MVGWTKKTSQPIMANHSKAYMFMVKSIPMCRANMPRMANLRVGGNQTKVHPEHSRNTADQQKSLRGKR